MSNPLLNRALGKGVNEGRGVPAGPGPQQGQPFMTGQQLEEMYQRPSATPAQTRRLTYEDVLMKTGMSFGVLLVAAAVGWFVPALALIGAIAGLVLGLVNAFKKEPSPVLVLAYAATMGLFLGGISGIFEAVYPGIVMQAVLASLAVFTVMLVLFRLKIVRVQGKFAKFMMLAVAGYAAFSLANLVFGAISGTPWGVRGMSIGLPIVGEVSLGLIIGIVAVVLAAFSLVMDFQMIEQGVEQGIPEKYSWSLAFGLMATLIWLYVEILRILAILRGGD